MLILDEELGFSGVMNLIICQCLDNEAIHANSKAVDLATNVAMNTSTIIKPCSYHQYW